VEWLRSLDEALFWRGASALVLLWLAVFFGRTLRAGQIPLIERIARVSEPGLPPALCRYTRRLTALWCAYFLLSALLSLTTASGFLRAGVLVWTGTAVLFIGERLLRPHFFPGQSFPGLLQQLRDTWSVWHPRKAGR
jgi:uncharacterized membrane protein